MKTNLTLSLVLFLFVIAQVSNAQNVIRFYENGKVGYKKSTGEIIIPATYPAGSEMMENYAIVLKGNKRGYINDKGETIIPFIYDDASVFSSGLACVMKENKYGYINMHDILLHNKGIKGRAKQGFFFVEFYAMSGVSLSILNNKKQKSN